MNGFQTRVKLWDRKKHIMLPSAPLYKCDFFHTDISKYILLFSFGGKDKNEKMIYQCDVVKVPAYRTISFHYPEQTMEVIYSLDKFTLSVHCDFAWSELEIIGNKYENPELLNETA